MRKDKKFQIRTFQPKDTKHIVDLIDKVLKDIEVIPASDPRIDDEDLFKIPQVYFGKGRFWVAIENNKIIGTVAIRDMGDNIAKLNRMFVDINYHGSGVGQQLLNTAINFTKSQNYSEIILNTSLLMHRAHHFYEKNGFIKYDQDSEQYHYKLIF